MEIDAKTLRSLLNYDHQTGEFTWREGQRGPARAGDIAGRVKPNGYRSIKIRQRDYFAHRLAVLYMTGAWPPKEVDHANGDRSDNRWGNLRLATVQQNRGNSKINRRNVSGLKGVSIHKPTGLYRARISTKTIGYYATPEEAHAVYMASARERFGEFASARGGRPCADTPGRP